MAMTTPGPRNSNRGPQQGRPKTEEVLGNKDPKEERIKSIFRDQFRALGALFPEDGETMVTRAMQAAVMASRTKPLRDSPAEAIAEKVIACHALGLEIGDQAYLVPYKAEVQLIIGPRGLIALAYRSGFVKSIEARSVFAPDYFDYELGDKPFIRHKKATSGRREAPITHSYVVIETTTGGTIREVLTQEDIEFYRSFSKASSGPWIDNYEGMCRKTAIKRGCEFVPRSPLLSAALKENEQGAYEIPEEILNAARGSAFGFAETAAPEDRTVVLDVPAGMRQPGAD